MTVDDGSCIHGGCLARRIIDTQSVFPLASGGRAKLRSLVHAMLPQDEWADFQADGREHPPDRDAEALDGERRTASRTPMGRLVRHRASGAAARIQSFAECHSGPRDIV